MEPFSKFQSTLPTRGSDISLSPNRQRCTPISIHAPHEGERLILPFLPALHAYFNPRSPRGGATYTRGLMVGFVPISIHAPHEGERLAALGMGVRVWAFQSTLPTRGSDWHRLMEFVGDLDFNPRSPRGGATIYYVTCRDKKQISIHAPHEGERPSTSATARP